MRHLIRATVYFVLNGMSAYAQTADDVLTAWADTPPGYGYPAKYEATVQLGTKRSPTDNVKVDTKQNRTYTVWREKNGVRVLATAGPALDKQAFIDNADYVGLIIRKTSKSQWVLSDFETGHRVDSDKLTPSMITMLPIAYGFDYS